MSTVYSKQVLWKEKVLYKEMHWWQIATDVNDLSLIRTQNSLQMFDLSDIIIYGYKWK